MSEKEKLAMYVANCQICTLAEAMKNCPICRFRVGLAEKQIKEGEKENVQN